jgi:conjugative transfer signal peptidase TraF
MYSIQTGRYNVIQPKRAGLLKRTGVISIATVLGLFIITGKAGVRINMTPSVPPGLYIEISDSNLVEFSPSGPPAALAAARGYRIGGNCDDGASPLLKPVVARTGDTVEYSGNGIAVNGRLLLNTAPLSKDTDGRLLQHFPYGRYDVLPGQVWVASTYNPRSFDSRYFGAIDVSSIRAHLRPLLTK